MYVVTFYSFRGGVGRTMALVNVGVELAKTGRRVLLVDFDLEAPGLDTFNLPQPREQTLGLVDYVSRYQASGEAPDANEYILECPGIGGSSGGGLWMMPAGRQDEMYGLRLASIDWQRLYREHNGYLMFEDLKAQWKRAVDPHYVLIDSRTGHTEVGGICTRQLPNTVVILFFPNEENLRGLTKVVADIRKEAHGPRKKDIRLHFVAANVPDLDDEDRIVEATFRRFREQLGYRVLSGVIHHYSSLALLNQIVFTEKRPRSRLAQEYRELLGAIVANNAEDREGALEFLQRLTGRPRSFVPTMSIATGELENRLGEIRRLHTGDGRVLYHIALVRERQGRLEEALTLLNEAIDSGYREPEALLRRAEMLRYERVEDAVKDLSEVLRSKKAGYLDVNRAVRWLRDLAPEMLKEVPQAPAVMALDFDGRLNVAEALLAGHAPLVVAEELLRELATSPDATPDRRTRAANDWAVCLIGLGRFNDAMRAMSASRPHPLDLDIYGAFNYAMAEWAETGTPPRDFLERVRELDRQAPPEGKTPNYPQCMAIMNWLLDDVEEARRRVSQARQQLMTRPIPEFSAWRYLTVSPRDFLADLDVLLSGIEGKQVLPAFMTASKRAEASARGGA